MLELATSSPVSETSCSTAPAMPISIASLPFELIEAILGVSRLSAVSAFSQTCKTYHDLIYRPNDTHLWRILFLNQAHYDDPRLVLGKDAHIPWDTLLRRWTSAGRALRAHAPRYTLEVLQTLIQMVEYARPAPKPLALDSRNLEHLHGILWSSGFFSHMFHPGAKDDLDSDLERAHLIIRLKLYTGMEAVVAEPYPRLRARTYVYDLRNYHEANEHGPFIPDGSGRINWRHLYAIMEVMVMNIMDFVEPNQPGLPMTMKHTQPQSIPRSSSADERDWAGIEGTWQVIFCFCDHRDLLAFNRREFFGGPNLPIFANNTFQEALRFLEFELSVERVEDPSATTSAFQSYPTLHFVGKVSGNARMKGRVYMTPDKHIRWSFVSGEPGQAIWSTEAVQIGGVASAFGALGAWTTVSHDMDDPVGPIWLWKLP
ncbi:hypothetical protein K439DRAFT_1398185 [Ramaria rubella]|nr:hypothetical protein K439DRAFT_1398185 [Ramaria rubella]